MLEAPPHRVRFWLGDVIWWSAVAGVTFVLAAHTVLRQNVIVSPSTSCFRTPIRIGIRGTTLLESSTADAATGACVALRACEGIIFDPASSTYKSIASLRADAANQTRFLVFVRLPQHCQPPLPPPAPPVPMPMLPPPEPRVPPPVGPPPTSPSPSPPPPPLPSSPPSLPPIPPSPGSPPKHLSCFLPPTAVGVSGDTIASGRSFEAILDACMGAPECRAVSQQPDGTFTAFASFDVLLFDDGPAVTLWARNLQACAPPVAPPLSPPLLPPGLTDCRKKYDPLVCIMFDPQVCRAADDSNNPNARL